MKTNKKIASALVVAGVGLATGGVVLTTSGGAAPAPQPAPENNITALTAFAAQDSGSVAALARMDKSPLIASRGVVSDAGVVAATITGPGSRKLDVRVDTPHSEVCTGDRPDGGAISGSWCTNLPIPISQIPYAASGTPSDKQLSLNALVPDNVSSVSATNANGVTRTAAPRYNVAFVVMPDNTPVKRVEWTTTSGEKYGQDVPEGGTQ